MDNWRHHSDEMKCQTCMFFVPKADDPLSQRPRLIGRCHKHSPALNGWPTVFSNDRCGDHRVDEDKIS